MANSLQSYDPREDDIPVAGEMRKLLGEAPREGVIAISKGQLFIAWSCIAGMMILVFVFGFHAGRDQGLEAAFASKGKDSVRLPLNTQLSAASDEGALFPGLPDGKPSAAVALASGRKSQVPKIETVQEFNFSKGESLRGKLVNSLPKVEGSASKLSGNVPIAAGFGSAPSGEVLRENAKIGKVGTNNSAVSAKKDLKQTEKSAPQKNAKLSEVERSKTARLASKKAKSQKTTAVAPSINATEKIKKGWYVQASARSEVTGALRIADQYQTAGYSAHVQEAKVKDRTFFRVLIGPYQGRAGAIVGKKKVDAHPLTKGASFLKRIK